MTTRPRWATWIMVIILIVSGMEEEITVLGQGVAHGHRVLHHLGVGGALMVVTLAGGDCMGLPLVARLLVAPPPAKERQLGVLDKVDKHNVRTALHGTPRGLVRGLPPNLGRVVFL